LIQLCFYAKLVAAPDFLGQPHADLVLHFIVFELICVLVSDLFFPHTPVPLLAQLMLLTEMNRAFQHSKYFPLVSLL
jgi:hypothetical protein